MLVAALVGARHAGIARGSEQAPKLGTAFFRVAGASGRAPLPHSAALRAAGRVAALLEHGLSD
eukprot:2434988-Alexandrium_andersonii.AAC.1